MNGAAGREIERIARDLVAPLIEESSLPGGWRLVSWDAEQGFCLTFERGPVCLLVELEERNESMDCYARTARFNVCVRRQLEDAPLSQEDRSFADTVIAAVRAREAALPDPERPAVTRKAEVREIAVGRLLVCEGRNQYYINPYVGCLIACPFCYVIDRADFSRRLEGLPQLPWGRYLDVKVNAAEVLRREVRGLTTGIVRMSPILTDPYQPAERRYRVTRQCLEVLLESDLAPVILTRAPRILEDLELLKRFRRVLAGLSIPTDTDRYRQIFEPGADPIEDRLQALRALHEAGVPTFAVIQPVLPMNVENLVEQIAPFARVVRLDRLYAGERVRQLYEEHGLVEWATEEFANGVIARLDDAFRSRGVRVDPLDDLQSLLDGSCE